MEIIKNQVSISKRSLQAFLCIYPKKVPSMLA